MGRQRLAGKVVWVVGASSGLGAACAVRLVEEGARVVLSARRAERLAEVRARCARPDDVALLPLDVTEVAAHASRAADAEAPFGPLDALVFCAGVSQRALAEDTDLSVDRRIMELNFFAPVSLAKALLPRFLPRRAGHLVVVSSVQGHLATRGRTAYAASKHALHGFFDSLRAEVADRGVAVTLVAPGYVRTELSASALKGDGTAYGGEAAARDAAEGKATTPPERVAGAIADALVRRPPEVLVGGSEMLGVYLKRLSPRLLAWVVRRRRAAGV
jgi:NAD(P)-dependent dehydrogenase (short-subunit alcohol dehydrogenase family)